MVDRAPFLEAIASIAPEFGLDIGPEVAERFARHYELLLTWNQRLNLTRIVEPREVARFHFLESAYAARFVPAEAVRVVDVGSGAGFPGLPLAALAPERPMVLVEANLKRTVFLKEAARTMALPFVSVRNERFDKAHIGPDDVVVARAVDRFHDLLPALLTSSARDVVLFGDSDLLDDAVRAEPSRVLRVLHVPGSDRRSIGSLRFT